MIQTKKAGQVTIDRAAESKRRPCAFSLVETVFSILLVSGLVVAALQTVGASTTAQRKIGDGGRGQLFAADLLNEVLAQNYSDADETPTLGRETLEISATTRADFDDVDDYNGYWESPPTHKDGTILPYSNGWSRQVSVTWVDPNNATLARNYDTGVKLISVVARKNEKSVAALAALRTGKATNSGIISLPIDPILDLLDPSPDPKGGGIMLLTE